MWMCLVVPSALFQSCSFLVVERLVLQVLSDCFGRYVRMVVEKVRAGFGAGSV